jgi:hypothetical protein
MRERCPNNCGKGLKNLLATFGGLQMKFRHAFIVVAGMLAMAGAVRADTIVTSGGHVTGINGITIAGTTYNVTWGPVDDTTFAASPTNAAAMSLAIMNDLNSSGATVVAAAPPKVLVTAIGVDAGTYALVTVSGYGSPWGAAASTQYGGSGGGCGCALWGDYVLDYGADAWDEFSVASVATPEPGTTPLTLTGLGLLGLIVVIRKRIVQGRAQAT